MPSPKSLPIPVREAAGRVLWRRLLAPVPDDDPSDSNDPENDEQDDEERPDEAA
jgi:hypothetical protein